MFVWRIKSEKSEALKLESASGKPEYQGFFVLASSLAIKTRYKPILIFLILTLYNYIFILPDIILYSYNVNRNFYIFLSTLEKGNLS